MATRLTHGHWSTVTVLTVPAAVVWLILASLYLNERVISCDTIVTQVQVYKLSAHFYILTIGVISLLYIIYCNVYLQTIRVIMANLMS